MAEHSLTKSHTINWFNAKVLKTSSNEFQRKTNEAIAIRVYNNNNNLLNRNKGEFFPNIWINTSQSFNDTKKHALISNILFNILLIQSVIFNIFIGPEDGLSLDRKRSTITYLYLKIFIFIYI